VVFMSDNGPDPLTGERFNEELRGTKYQVYEGGIRVPCFFAWQGHIQNGRRDQVITGVDVFPTLLELCGLPAATVNPIDGKSLVNVLHDKAVPFETTRCWQWNRANPNYTHNAAVRQGTFKLVRPYVTRGIRLKDSQLPSVLYDLENDPRETTDVSASYPDVFENLKKSLEAWCASVEHDRTRRLVHYQMPH
ncbi:MAG: sulfatase/phosphatase domain-containing protein, partial [Planctomycetota bacterium]